MEPLDELEIILKGMINQKKKELDRKAGEGIQLSTVYLNGVDLEKIGPEKALYELWAIKENSPNLSDEIVQKMYGSAKPV